MVCQHPHLTQKAFLLLKYPLIQIQNNNFPLQTEKVEKLF